MRARVSREGEAPRCGPRAALRLGGPRACVCPRCRDGLFEGSASHDSACPLPARSSPGPQRAPRRERVRRRLPAPGSWEAWCVRIPEAAAPRQTPECSYLGGGEGEQARAPERGARSAHGQGPPGLRGEDVSARGPAGL